jgi:hypothetical protein
VSGSSPLRCNVYFPCIGLHSVKASVSANGLCPGLCVGLTSIGLGPGRYVFTLS